MTVKKLFLSAFLTLNLLFLAACGGASGTCSLPAEEDAPSPSEDPAQLTTPCADPDDEVTCGPGVPYSMVCRIVDGAEEGSLLLAELPTAGLIPSGGSVYRLSVKDIEVWLDGEKADSSVLEDGMPIHISYRGPILETYPAQISEVLTIEAYSLGSEQNPVGGYYDLCGLYLQVLDDLWEKDSGLNSGAELVSVDLSEAPGGLTDSEKSAIAWRFGELHGVTALQATMEELKEGGYLTETKMSETTSFYEWEDGVYCSITDNSQEGEVFSLPALKFTAHKWRTPLGAYWLSDCSAVWPEFGAWSSYDIGAEMIS